MDEKNDLTLRGIFRGNKRNIDEWRDRQRYREKFERTLNISHSNFYHDMYIFGVEPDSILKPKYDGVKEEKYLFSLSNMFPESKTAKKFIAIMSFGMGPNSNGYYTCDCCGVELHALNSFDYRYLCEVCDNWDGKVQHGQVKQFQL